jgi:hypothetical protein
MRLLSASVVAFALWSAGPAAAEQEPAHSPSPHLAAAQMLYKKLNLDAALDALKDAETDARARNDQDEMVQVLVLKGLILAENGKQSEMDDQFKHALAVRPWAELPPDVSPRLAKRFHDLRKDLWGAGSQLKPPPKKRAVAAKANPPAPAPASAPTDLEPPR